MPESVEAKKLTCDLAQWLSDNISVSAGGNFLAIGARSNYLAEKLVALKMPGVIVTDGEITKSLVENLVVVRTPIGADPHFVRGFEGYWRRPVTVQEIFNQWGGPYSLIAIIGTEMDREVWSTANVQAALPKHYILEEDDHNEEIILRSIERGYRADLTTDDYLVLTHA